MQQFFFKSRNQAMSSELKPAQDYDRNGDKSNSYTREAARERLTQTSGLSQEQRQAIENKTQCLRGDALRARETGQSAPLDRLKRA
jgi:hypothetical protein